jgi:hypothetical protein
MRSIRKTDLVTFDRDLSVKLERGSRYSNPRFAGRNEQQISDWRSQTPTISDLRLRIPKAADLD